MHASSQVTSIRQSSNPCWWSECQLLAIVIVTSATQTWYFMPEDLWSDKMLSNPAYWVT